MRYNEDLPTREKIRRNHTNKVVKKKLNKIDKKNSFKNKERAIEEFTDYSLQLNDIFDKVKL